MMRTGMKSRFGKDRCILTAIANKTKLLVVNYDSITSMEEPAGGYVKLITTSDYVYITKEDSIKLQNACLGILPTEEII